MLVLSRQRDETIMIGDEIEITVVDIRGDKVRLGISAPTQIAVHRKEVYEAIRKENEQAAQVSDADLGSIAAPRGTGASNGRAAGLASKASPRTPETQPSRHAGSIAARVTGPSG